MGLSCIGKSKKTFTRPFDRVPDLGWETENARLPASVSQSRTLLPLWRIFLLQFPLQEGENTGDYPYLAFV
jgi:hypothetical protein